MSLGVYLDRDAIQQINAFLDTLDGKTCPACGQTWLTCWRGCAGCLALSAWDCVGGLDMEETRTGWEREFPSLAERLEQLHGNIAPANDDLRAWAAEAKRLEADLGVALKLLRQLQGEALPPGACLSCNGGSSWPAGDPAEHDATCELMPLLARHPKSHQSS